MVKNWVKSQLVKVSAHLIVTIEILHLRSIGDISIAGFGITFIRLAFSPRGM
jgi:hypothetical protein